MKSIPSFIITTSHLKMGNFLQRASSEEDTEGISPPMMMASSQPITPPEPLPALDNATFDPSQCTVREVDPEIAASFFPDRKAVAIVIDNVLSEEECRQWIELSERAGYTEALVNIGSGRERKILDYRNSSRCIIDDAERAREVFERIKPFLGDALRIEEKQPFELNERLRFLRYHPGEFFAPHLDGRYYRLQGHPRFGDCSLITFQLYLNEGFQGGTTRFFHATDKSKIYDVVPKTGSVLLFEHRMEHSGEKVTEGCKYAVRSDIMFAPVS